MQAAGPALSIAAIGLKAAGDYSSSRGVAAGDTVKAEELDRAAQYGDLKATQTNAQMTRNLSITLGNIDAVRAAARTDPTSPTGAAVRDYTEYTGEEQKNIKVSSIMAQATQDEADAAYMRTAASRALLAGDLAIAGDIAGGLGGAVGGLPGGGAGSGVGGGKVAA
jgi:hypothetical protein